MVNGLNIKQDMLVWAITRAGFTIDGFAQKYPRIVDWLEEKKSPTLKQLEDFSKKVHLPMGYLFLPQPVNEAIPFPLFRANNPPTNKVSVNLYDTILLLQRRQGWLKEYLIEHEREPLAFVGKFNQNSDPNVVAADIRETLGFQQNWASNFPNWASTLDHLTQKIEETGIIVVFNGIVENNNYRPISVAECRGFILVDNIAPFMFVNNGDAKSAQLFTIAHELAHIWLGESAGFNNEKLLPSNDPIELLCDKIAAEFLVPKAAFTIFWSQHPSIPQSARNFKVSEIVIARRAFDLGFLNRNQFFTFYNNYSAREYAIKENAAGGGNFYATTKGRLSLAFAAHIQQAVKSGELLYRDAYKLTGLKGVTYDTFFKTYF